MAPVYGVWWGLRVGVRSERDTQLFCLIAHAPTTWTGGKAAGQACCLVRPLSPAHSSDVLSRASQGSSMLKSKLRFWAYFCFPLRPKNLPANYPLVLPLPFMSPPIPILKGLLEPKERSPKIVICKHKNLDGLLGSWGRGVHSCLFSSWC